ncbi:DNA polymerase IV [Streptomyces sp. NBC_01795]|uniref:DNA polymerase IV n=1 Tax=Streptomyces sp. NBC_01795 TaxID=2975943 RepID=UPI002DD9A232|nr:DNA polymerase IV [Streptomyces sp. NBC_01795]WSA96551.1 DNA polymerase IV [Streptomyces sp. NBC_01795]
MRSQPTILHLDMDAFFAAVEQASKPSLRGKPVVVGGLGPRGVVSTASYEARRFGVHSAMPTAQARRLCPNAAYLGSRFGVYRAVSDMVMELLHRLSPLVEPLSLDEAFVDLEAGEALDGTSGGPQGAREVGERLRADIRAATGLSGSVGLAGSKMLAKIASEQAKPDGLVLIEPGTEREMLAPLTVRTLPGVGPATAETLRRAGITSVGEVVEAGVDELLRLLGKAHGTSVHAMAYGTDDRPVVAERDAKSVSVEDTYDVDLTDRTRVRLEVERLAGRCVTRLRAAGRSGRTVVIKVRSYDFSTLTRSETLRGPTDDPGVVKESAQRLLEGVDTTAGVRLLGVAVSGLADFTQEDLFAQAQAARSEAEAEAAQEAAEATKEAAGAGEESALSGAHEPVVLADRQWIPGRDVRHAEHGRGWVQGSGVGKVTVRFEEPDSPPGRVRTFSVDDPDLEPAEPRMLDAQIAAVLAWREGASGSGGRADQSPAPATRPKSRSGGTGASPPTGTSSP